MKKISILLIIALLSSLLCSCQLYDVTKTILDKNKAWNEDAAANERIDPHGTINGYLYTNELLGLNYRIDSSWGYYDGEKALAYLGLSEDDLTEYEFFDVLASDTYYNNNMSVYFRNIGTEQMATLDMDQYLNSAFTSAEDRLTGLGYKIINSKITDVNLDGKKLDAIYFSCDNAGLNTYCVQIIFPCKGYIVHITVNTTGSDTTADVLDNFYWLD
ncbi:MAG: hypothetical protein IKW68_02260 [Clostridia bacterium]|nr:hypothetical protein [Clostridia bacterium]